MLLGHDGRRLTREYLHPTKSLRGSDLRQMSCPVSNGASAEAADRAMKRLGVDTASTPARARAGRVQGFLPLPSSESTTCT